MNQLRFGLLAVIGGVLALTHGCKHQKNPVTSSIKASSGAASPCTDDPVACELDLLAQTDPNETSHSPTTDPFKDSPNNSVGNSGSNTGTNSGIGLRLDGDLPTAPSTTGASDNLTLAEVNQIIDMLGGGDGASLRLDGETTPDLPQSVAAGVLVALIKYVTDNPNLDSGSGDNAGSGTKTDTQTDTSASATSTDVSTAALRLADSPPSGANNQNTTTAQMLARQRIQNLRTNYAGRNPMFGLIENRPDQAQCVAHGAYLKNGTCQCRGWGMDVNRHTFAPGANVLRNFLVTQGQRKCPVLETQFCHGWETMDGGCGIFGKGVGYGIPALAWSPTRVAGDEQQCWKTIDKIVQENANTLFSPPASCDEYIAIKRGQAVDLWQYSRANGGVLQQVDGTQWQRLPGNNPAIVNQPSVKPPYPPAGQLPGTQNRPPYPPTGTPPGIQQPYPPPYPPPSPSATSGSGQATQSAINALMSVCQSIPQARWTGNSCQCGPFLVMTATQFQGFSQANQQRFANACTQSVNH